MNFRLIESKVTHLHIFPLRTHPDCLCWMGKILREAAVYRAKIFLMYTAVKSILFAQRSRHSRGESHILKCLYIFHARFPNHFPGHSSFVSPGWRISTDLHITLCVFKCEKHAFSASRTKCPVHVCMCVCVWMCIQTGLYGQKHSLCVCIFNQACTCIHHG